MSTIKSKKLQLGLSNTNSNNFTLTSDNLNSELILSRGNAEDAISEIFTIDSSNNLTISGDLLSSTGEHTISPVSGFKNQIINGEFNLWTYGTSSSSSGYNTADRWSNSTSGSTNTVSRQSGMSNTSNPSRYFCRNTVSSVAGSGNYSALVQKVENVVFFSNKKVTLSFWAKADSNKNMAVEFSQSFGTGGSPSADVTSIGVTTVALTSSWQKFSVSTTIPSVYGKTLGSDSNSSYLRVAFWFDAGSTLNTRTNSLGQQSGTFDISLVQLEEGLTTTNFELRPIGIETDFCGRYYQTLPVNITMYGTGGTTSGIFGTLNFPVKMRNAPTISYLGSNPTYTGSTGTMSSYTPTLTDSSVTFAIVGTTFTANGTFVLTLANGFSVSAEL